MLELYTSLLDKAVEPVGVLTIFAIHFYVLAIWLPKKYDDWKYERTYGKKVPK